MSHLASTVSCEHLSEEVYYPVKIEKEELIQEIYEESPCPHLTSLLNVPKKGNAKQEELNYPVKIEKEECKQEMYGEISSLHTPEFGYANDKYLDSSLYLPKNDTAQQEKIDDPVKIEKEKYILESHEEKLCTYVPESGLVKGEHLINSLDLDPKGTALQEENLGMNSYSLGHKLKIHENASSLITNKKMPSMLLNDIQTYTRQKSFECDSCSARFTRRSYLVNHLRTHTGEKPFECDSCFARFAQIATLGKHIRTHTGEKPHKCNSCSAKFARRSHLVDHIRTHSGEKPFECNSCSARFAQKNHLVNHIRTHTGEKPFKCDSCSTRFAQRGSLVKHVRMHIGKKPFTCDL